MENLGGTKIMQEKNQPKTLSAAEMSLVLNISEQTLKKLAKAREIPCVFINRRPRFKWDDIIQHFKLLEGGAA